jgi:hypothetical protein
MAAVTTPDQAYHIMRTQNLKFWTLREAPKAGVISRYDNDTDVETSIQELDRTLNNIEGDYVHLSLRKASRDDIANGERAISQYPNIKIKLPRGIQTSAGAQIAGPGFDRVLQEMEKRHQLELEHLREKLEAISQADDDEDDEPNASPLDRVIERVLEHPKFDDIISGLASALMPGKTRPTEPEPIMTGTDAEKALHSAIETFAELDPNYVNTLAKMAAHIKQHPETLNMVKNVIGA